MIQLRVHNLNTKQQTLRVKLDMEGEDLLLAYMKMGWYCRGPSTSGEFRLVAPDTWDGRYAAYFKALDEPATIPPTQEVP